MKYFQIKLSTCFSLLFLSSIHSWSGNKNSDPPTTPSKLTNVDIIGLGYDIVLGNPHTNDFDPGFKRAVIKLSYTENQLSADGKWLVPDHIQALQVLSCNFQSTTEEMHGMSSYSDSLSVDASISGGGWGFKFSASAGYHEVHTGTSSYGKSYVSSMATCNRYKLQTRGQATVKASDEFVADLKNLPESADDAKYLDFISMYGTHFADTVMMGAKMVIRHEFEQKAWAEMQQSGFNVKAGAEASFLGFHGGFSTATDKQKQAKQEFESKRSDVKESYLGSLPSPNGTWETWAQSTGQSPFPMQYTLRSLMHLLNPENIDNMDNRELTIKRELLYDAYSRYCGFVKACSIPDPDAPPISISNVTSDIIDVELLTCVPPYTLMSCGLSNVPGKVGDFSRYAIPISNTTCECEDSSGAYCHAWCSNSVNNFEIVSVFGNQGEFRANCPAGKKVIGCHIRVWGKTNINTFYYPSDGGSSCICYAGNSGADCVATCASNVYDYEVINEFGQGSDTVTAQCKLPSNFVLGCGIKNHVNSRSELRKVNVSSLSSCECYDHSNQPTCYAICGKFGTIKETIHVNQSGLATAAVYTTTTRHVLVSAMPGTLGLVMSIVASVLFVMLVAIFASKYVACKKGHFYRKQAKGYQSLDT